MPMTPGPGVHVTPHDGRWQVKVEGRERAESLHDYKADAEVAGRTLASSLQGEFVLHDAKGVIRTKDSYGNDPYPPAG